MYSRQNAPRGQSAPWQIPKNYSGNAFSSASSESDIPTEEEASEQSNETVAASAAPSSQGSDREDKKSGLFGLSRKGGGIGIEELLILGLVLLISQSDEGEGNNDLAFLLLLLLFIQ